MFIIFCPCHVKKAITVFKYLHWVYSIMCYVKHKQWTSSCTKEYLTAGIMNGLKCNDLGFFKHWMCPLRLNAHYLMLYLLLGEGREYPLCISSNIITLKKPPNLPSLPDLKCVTKCTISPFMLPVIHLYVAFLWIKEIMWQVQMCCKIYLISGRSTSPLVCKCYTKEWSHYKTHVRTEGKEELNFD